MRPEPNDRLGGYEDGYSAVPCLWGKEPGSLVREVLSRGLISARARVLDLGSGEGKNAVALSKIGCDVDAVEWSSVAIANGRAAFPGAHINWIQADALEFKVAPRSYDLVISYGLTHCLKCISECDRLIKMMKRSTVRGGVIILCSFNDGSHDLRAHPDFKPLLMSHEYFTGKFKKWELIINTNSILYETHPHNQIPHHHSLTRIMAVRP